MNSEQAAPLNIQTVEPAIAPRDEIVSASPAESPVTFEELHAIYSPPLQNDRSDYQESRRCRGCAARYIAAGTFGPRHL
jgi:hypothetical protein